MRTVTIDDHTFCPDLLTETGWIIDAGARGFKLAQWMAENKPKIHHEDFNYNTYCLDIENFDKPEGNIVTVFKHAGLSGKSGQANAYYFGNGTGNFIEGLNGVPGNLPDRPVETKSVNLITLDDIYGDIGTNIDLLKMDIELSEYEVMLNMKPIPRMVSVEFHQHVNENYHKQYIDQVIDHMEKDYTMTLYCRSWFRYKFLDTLFIRRDLL